MTWTETKGQIVNVSIIVTVKWEEQGRREGEGGGERRRGREGGRGKEEEGGRGGGRRKGVRQEGVEGILMEY